MKIRVNTQVIAKYRPCKSRYSNWLEYYEDFDGDLVEFLDLLNITAQDKIWVAVRVLPRHLAEIFAIDCAVSAADADAAYAAAADAADADAAYATYAAAYAVTYAATYAADAERQRQIESIIWLVQNA